MKTERIREGTRRALGRPTGRVWVLAAVGPALALGFLLSTALPLATTLPLGSRATVLAGDAIRVDDRRAGPGRDQQRRPERDREGRQAIVKLDDFEDPAWPDENLWQVIDARAPTWWPSSCRARSGSRSLWAFGGRIGEFEQPCGAGAPLGSTSGIVQRLDLRQAAQASELTLVFDLWLRMPPGEEAGFFIFLRVPDDSEFGRVPVFGVTGSGGEWVYPKRQLDLMALADVGDPREVYDLRGRVWELEWVAHAPAGTAPGGGIFVDDLYLVWEPDAAQPAPTRKPTGTRPPATERPTARPSATSTGPSPSPSPPPQSPTTTRTPIAFGEIYLPRLVYELPPAADTATPSPEAVPSGSPGPPGVTPTIGVATTVPFPTRATPEPLGTRSVRP